MSAAWPPRACPDMPGMTSEPPRTARGLLADLARVVGVRDDPQPAVDGWTVIRRIDLPTGERINVHHVSAGGVYFQRFAPGVQRQGMWADLWRVETEEFERLIAAGRCPTGRV